ncbi:MAG: MFS transporter [Marinisporobacter sp.]|nr:MFS transporter [Marinisporobacter sp.]
MNDMKKVKFKILSYAIVLILIAMGFTGLYNLSKFKNNLEDSLFQTYKVAGNQGVRYIEYAVKYGKDIEKFYGIEEVLENMKALSDSIDDIYLFSKDKRYLYSTEGALQNDFEYLNEIGEDKKEKVIFKDKKYHVIINLNNENKETIGFVDITTSADKIDQVIYDFMINMIFYLGGILFVVIVCMVFLVNQRRLIRNGYIRSQLLKRVLIGMLMVSQILFCSLTFMEFQDQYRIVAKEDAKTVVNALRSDIKNVLNKNVLYEQLSDLEDYFQSILNQTSILYSIELNKNEANTYYAEKEEELSPKEKVSTKIVDAKGDTLTIQAKISEESIRKKLIQVLIDMGTALIISILFMLELVGVITLSVNQINKNQLDHKDRTNSIRALSFAVFAITTMYVSFIPIISKNVFTPIGNIPKNVLIGFPYTAEMFSGIFATIIAGALIDKNGWREAFKIGALLLIIGNIISAMGKILPVFIIARAITGFGFGTVLMAMRTIVLSGNSIEERNDNISGMNIGGSVGATCGIVIGAMIADQWDFTTVFYLSSGLMTLVALFLYKSKFMIHDQIKNERESEKSNLIKFLLNPTIIFLILVVIIPTRLGRTFLNYYFPLFASDQAISQSNIGQVFMLSSLSSIMFSAWVIKFMNKYLGVKMTIVASLLIMGGAVGIFSAIGNFLTMIIAIMILSVFDKSLGAATFNYYLSLKDSKKYGKGKAISVYSMSEKMGDTVSPMIYAGAMGIGITVGISYIGMIMIIGSLLFGLVVKTTLRKKEKEVS